MWPGSSQSCALGSAIAASVLAGQHPDFASAAGGDDQSEGRAFRAIEANKKVYDRLYALYRELYDSFGGLTQAADLTRVMKDLIEIKYAQRA